MARNNTSEKVKAVLKKDRLTISQLSERLCLTTTQVRAAVSRMVTSKEISSSGGRPAEYWARP